MISPEYFDWIEKHQPDVTELPEFAEFKNLSSQEKLKLLKVLAYAIGKEEVQRIKSEIDALREKKKRLEEEKRRIQEKIKRIDREIHKQEERLRKIRVNKSSLTILF